MDIERLNQQFSNSILEIIYYEFPIKSIQLTPKSLMIIDPNDSNSAIMIKQNEKKLIIKYEYDKFCIMNPTLMLKQYEFESSFNPTEIFNILFQLLNLNSLFVDEKYYF